MNQDHQAALRARFRSAMQAPPLMMLYPPVATGAVDGEMPTAAVLWGEVAGAATLYVHVPFCPSRCVFCPFHATVGKPRDYQTYIDNVLREAALYAESLGGLEFSSVYFGGGTPSVLPPPLLRRFLDDIDGVLAIADADVTLEAHPGTLDRARLGEFCEAGVTRLSLGVQSFDAAVLAAAGCGGTCAAVHPVLEAALETPFREVNIDLMYGLPNQSMTSWQADLATAVALEVPGLTLYSTVYLPGFTAYCEKNATTIPGAETRLSMYDFAYDRLTGEGYPQPHFGAGAFLRGGLNPHRRNVALGRPTLGLGAWSYSTTERFAYHNRYPRAEWAAALDDGRLPIGRFLRIPRGERARKYVIEAMLLAYLDLARFEQLFGAPFGEVFTDELEVLGDLGLGVVEQGELRLTRKGGRHLREIRYLFASDAVVETLDSGRAAGL